MANTYTDSSGNVFPLNAYGRPQGYWQGNKFIFPKFGNQPAAAQPTVEPVQPVVQPTNPYRLPSSVQQQAQDSAGGDPTQFGGVPQGSTSEMVAANNQGNPSVAPSPTPSSSSLFGGTPNISINPAIAQSLGGRVGSMTGIPGAGLLGSIAGGLAGGRGGRGIAGDVIGTGLGTALLGPLGFLGGVAGGRIGDMKDMEAALALGPRGQRGFWSSLGHGIGIGPSVNQQMEDYYGINQPGIDPFGAGLPAGTMTAPIGGGAVTFDEDDIGDIDPASQTNPFGDIADAFGQGDDGMGNMGGDQGGWT